MSLLRVADTALLLDAPRAHGPIETSLVHCVLAVISRQTTGYGQRSCARLATAWRLRVARPFKAGVPGGAQQIRGTQRVPEPSATLSRHAVTHTVSNAKVYV